jgi:hypothetical protein
VEKKSSLPRSSRNLCLPLLLWAYSRLIIIHILQLHASFLLSGCSQLCTLLVCKISMWNTLNIFFTLI